ncbi:hypothetical protein [Nocardia heshunensis]
MEPRLLGGPETPVGPESLGGAAAVSDAVGAAIGALGGEFIIAYATVA